MNKTSWYNDKRKEIDEQAYEKRGAQVIKGRVFPA
jgi:hypothetical protein